MFIKKDCYFGSYAVKGSDFYLFAIGVPDGEGQVTVNIYGGNSLCAAICIFGSFMTADNQEAFEKSVNETLEALGDQLPKAYESMMADGTRLI